VLNFFLQAMVVFEHKESKPIMAHQVLPTYPPLLKRKTRLPEYGNGWIQSETIS
jgi:hypothetical protein